jgi:hypothetical protein
LKQESQIYDIEGQIKGVTNHDSQGIAPQLKAIASEQPKHDQKNARFHVAKVATQVSDGARKGYEMVVREIGSCVRDGNDENGEESGLREPTNARLVAGGGPENFENHQTAGQNGDQVGRPEKQGIRVVRELVNQEPDDFSGKNTSEVSEEEGVSLEKAIESAAQEDESLQRNAAPPD